MELCSSKKLEEYTLNSFFEQVSLKNEPSEEDESCPVYNLNLWLRASSNDRLYSPEKHTDAMKLFVEIVRGNASHCYLLFLRVS